METNKPEKILIVDDTPAIIDLLKDLLQSKGMEVYIATSGDKALQIAQTIKPDIVLLDILMPGINGYETCTELKKNNNLAEVPIIIMSALNEPFDKVKAFQVGASDYITKPIEQEEFFARLNNHLRMYSLQRQMHEMNEKLEQRVIIRTNELLLAKEKAEESDRLKSSFLANISHEIRTPLNGILGFSELLSIPGLDEKTHSEYIHTIADCGEKLLKTVNDILELSKLQAGIHKFDFASTDIHAIIKTLYKKFENQADKKNLRLIIKNNLTSSGFNILADGPKIEQIFNILIENAIKFTNNGQIEFGYNVKNREIEFFVEDTGIGIPKHFTANLFESFRQAEETLSREYGGTGAGLAICKGLTDLMRGKIKVSSEEGKGTAFYFSIPYEPANAIIPEKQQIEHTIKNTTNEKIINILVAEDEDANFYYINEILKLMDIDVNIIHARNGIEAVNFVKERPDITTVLMDIKMPEMDGVEALGHIKALRPLLPIIAVTAYASNDDKRRFLNAGFDNYISKPVKASNLIDLVKMYS